MMLAIIVCTSDGQVYHGDLRVSKNFRPYMVLGQEGVRLDKVGSGGGHGDWIGRGRDARG